MITSCSMPISPLSSYLQSLTCCAFRLLFQSFIRCPFEWFLVTKAATMKLLGVWLALRSYAGVPEAAAWLTQARSTRGFCLRCALYAHQIPTSVRQLPVHGAARQAKCPSCLPVASPRQICARQYTVSQAQLEIRSLQMQYLIIVPSSKTRRMHE